MSTISQQLDYGSTGQAVLDLQNFLVAQGFLSPADLQTGPGTYGPKTLAAVQAFQRANGIISTGDPQTTGYGRVGPKTLSSINEKLALMPAANTTGTSGTATKTPVPTLTPTPTPTPTGTSQGSTQRETGVTGGTPYFMGKGSLVRLTGLGTNGYNNAGTVWLVDPESKTLRPFQNSEAIGNFFDGEISLNDIHTINASEMNDGGMFGGYVPLDTEYMIKADGTAKKLDYSTAQLQARYGNPIDTGSEQDASTILDGFLTALSASGSGIDQNKLNTLKSNTAQLAFYINAMAYGEYSLNDIYRDIKARELGITSDISPISATATRQEYQNTPEGTQALSYAAITPPTSIGGLSITDLNLSLSSLPDEAFKTLIPILDVNSEEFKKQMSEIKDAYNDILIEKVNAGTEQEKAIADDNWEKFRENLSRTYGIQISDNVTEAGTQIDNALIQFAKQGTMNSGLQNESVDDYLRKVRKNDQRLRDTKVTQEEAGQKDYYLKYATSAQIKELVNSNPTLAQKWGLVPSADIKNTLTLANLKAKYPDSDDATLQKYITSILDENGNYRSSLYLKKITDTQGYEADKENYQQSQVYAQSLRDEEKKYKEFTTPDIAFLRNVADNSSVGSVTPQAPREMVNLTDQIKNAGTSLKSSTASGSKTSGTQIPNTGSTGTQTPITQTPPATGGGSVVKNISTPPTTTSYKPLVNAVQSVNPTASKITYTAPKVAASTTSKTTTPAISTAPVSTPANQPRTEGSVAYDVMSAPFSLLGKAAKATWSKLGSLFGEKTSNTW